MRTVVSLLVLATVVIFAVAATAQARPNQSRFRSSAPPAKAAEKKDYNIVEEDGKKVLYKKRNVVDFDDSLIEGEVKNPSEFYFVHRPEEKFGSLVKKRGNFHKEMLRDTVMIR